MAKRKRLKARFDMGLNETGVGGVLGAAGGLALFEGFAHMGTAGLVFAGAAAVIGGLNGKLVADGGKFVAERMLVSPPASLAQETFGVRQVDALVSSGEKLVESKGGGIILGTDKRTRRDVEYTMYQLKGILILGLPGMGKTVTVSTIASQLVERGARLSIIDIKGQLDDSLTGLLAPFEAAFATPPAHMPQLMLETAEYADSILEDRLSKRTTDLYPFYLIIDEFTDLMLSLKSKDRYTEAATKIAEVVKRINLLGRSLNIYCFCVGQITTADTTGGTAIRETFITRILHGMSEYEAGIVDKNGGKKAISQLGVGEAYVTVGGVRAEPQVVQIRQISDQEKRRIADSIKPIGEGKETRLLPDLIIDTPRTSVPAIPALLDRVKVGIDLATKSDVTISKEQFDSLVNMRRHGLLTGFRQIMKIMPALTETHARNLNALLKKEAGEPCEGGREDEGD